MIKLTKWQALRASYEIWDLVYWLGLQEKPDTAYAHNCPLCIYVVQRAGWCRDCPVSWPRAIDNKAIVMHCARSLFGQWAITRKNHYAKHIVNLIQDTLLAHEAE